MPSGQRIRRETRRRSGCFQCKEKHVQCTEEQPRCRRCERLNLYCQRGLRLIFREDAIQRGISFGREGKWSKRVTECSDSTAMSNAVVNTFFGVPLDQYIGRWVFLNSGIGDFARTPKPHHRDPNGVCLGIPLSETPTHDEGDLPLVWTCLGHPLVAYSKVEQYLLDYFIQGIGPSCSLSPLDNPYISHITPLAFEDESLRYALLAVAGNQLCLLGDNRFQRETLLYKSRALKGLQRCISQGAMYDGSTATILMLCFHDISDECDPSWVTHLQAGLELVYQSPARCDGNQTLRRFFTMYFVAHDIMSRTASGTRDRGSKSIYAWTGTDDMDEIDMVMGCSRRLMILIDDISNLTDIPEIHYRRKMDELSNALCTLTQNLPSHSSDRADIAQIAETKRLAALLYLIERADPTHMDNMQGSTGPDNLNKHHIISSMLRILTTLSDAATLLWPLFILGHAGLENEEHRRFILDRLHRMQRTRNLGSVRRARKAVKRAFQGKDLGHGKEWGVDGMEFISLA